MALATWGQIARRPGQKRVWLRVSNPPAIFYNTPNLGSSVSCSILLLITNLRAGPCRCGGVGLRGWRARHNMAVSGDLLPSVLNMIWCIGDIGMVHTQAGECDLSIKEGKSSL